MKTPYLKDKSEKDRAEKLARILRARVVHLAIKGFWDDDFMTAAKALMTATHGDVVTVVFKIQLNGEVAEMLEFLDLDEYEKACGIQHHDH